MPQGPSCDCRHITDRDHETWYNGEQQPGDYMFEEGEDGRGGKATYLNCVLPTGAYVSLPLYLKGTKKPPHTSWEWDGNKEKPTLSPSVWHHGTGPREWHGFITAGRMVSC